MPDRIADTNRFYYLLKQLEDHVDGMLKLRDCNGRMGWPKRGVYFFFEEGEFRSGSATELRVVRVGTHALKSGAKSTLWGRLRQHRGVLKHDGGYHGHSIFRHHIGLALAKRDNCPVPTTWRNFSSDCDLERLVSSHIREMPFLWIKIDDKPGPNSLRGYIERSAIALLSNQCIDNPSTDWIGNHADNKCISASGLWNVNHTDETDYCPEFLETFGDLIERS